MNKNKKNMKEKRYEDMWRYVDKNKVLAYKLIKT